jgi:hypothetical protein
LPVWRSGPWTKCKFCSFFFLTFFSNLFFIRLLVWRSGPWTTCGYTRSSPC